MSNASSTQQQSGTQLDPLTGSLDAFLTLLRRRKILWEFHTATVLTNSIGTAAVSLLLDGDSNPITGKTICGPLATQQRVGVIFVPPAGYYVVGILGGVSPFGIVAAPMTNSANGANTTTTGVEVWDTSWDPYVFNSPGSLRCEVHMNGRMLFGNSTSLGDRYRIKIRDGGTADPDATSPLVAQLDHVLLGAAFLASATIPVIGTFVASRGMHNLGVFTSRVSGTGTVTPACPDVAAELYVTAIGLDPDSS